MARRIKILFTTSNFNTAGSGKVIYDLVNGLDRSKFEIEIACGNNKGDFFKIIQSLGLPIHLFETKTNYRPYHSLFKRIRHIVQFFKSQQYDIVHSWQWSNDWTEAVAAKQAGAKWIYTKKAMGFESKHWKIKSYLADFIITINDEMKDYFPNKKAQRLIPLGIDTDYYSPEQVPERLERKKFHLITVANLVPVKGIEILIQALYQMKDTESYLTIVGDCENSYGLHLKSLCHELGIEQQVAFVGKKQDVRPYIAMADVYVIPTLDQGRKEGMPMALVEAMSMAIPVLGSDISGIKFLLKEFQELLFKAGDPEALKVKIMHLKSMTQLQRKQIGMDLRHHCKAHFTLEAFLKAHENVYTDLANNRM